MEPPNMVKMDRFKRIQGATLVMGEKNYPLFKGVNTVGRNRTAVVNIKHLNVSQNQAIFVIVGEEQHYICDMDSSNGTFIHNTKLIPYKLYELVDKAEIKFGDIAAVYSKISEKDITINVNETIGINETQNMTQNFYASNTQLIINSKESESGDHNYFSNAPNSVMYIHEEPTQIVNNPLHLPFTQPWNKPTQIVNNSLHLQLTQQWNKPTQIVNNPLHLPLTQQLNKEPDRVAQECIIEEAVDDIHDAPTQVENMPKVNIETEADVQKIDGRSTQESANSDHSEYNKEIHEAPTQEINILENKINNNNIAVKELDAERSNAITSDNSNSGASTQILTSEENQQLIDRINKKNEVDITTQILSSDECQNIDNKIKENQVETKICTNSNKSSQNTQPLNLEQTEKMVNELNSKNKNDFVFQTKNKIHDSQQPTTSGTCIQTEYDESFLSATKNNISQSVIEESMLENPDSNDSIDFLHEATLTDNEKLQETSQLINHKAKKPVRKLPSTQSSNISQLSACSIESDLIRRPKKPIPKLPETQELPESDQETDLDDTQEIRFKKRKITRLMDTQNSDSETDMDTQPDKPQDAASKPSNSDSETDCEDEMLNKTNVEKNLISSTDVQGKTADLDDSDCIPATQDAFAEALGYKPIKSQNHSSEESFKLGLTELMEFPDNDNINEATENKDKAVKENENIKETENGQIDTKVHIDKTSEESEKDAVYLMPTQKIVESQKKFVFKKKTTNLEDSITTILSTKNDAETQETKDDDVFLQPTQKLDIKTSSRLKTGSQKTDELSEDIFLQPTQKLDSEIFAKPFPKDVFLQPTQIIEPKDGSISTRIPNTQDEDVYLASTQILQENTVKTTEEAIPMTQEDIYDQATQQIDKPTSNVPKLQTQDDYDVATQRIDDDFNKETQKLPDVNASASELPDHDTQLEMPFNTENIVLVSTESSNRPGNPIIRELEEPNKPESENNSPSVTEEQEKHVSEDPNVKEPTVNAETHSKVSDTESISQIETFIKEPLPPQPSTRKSVRKSKNESSERSVETLSQIEAFVKEPLPPRKSAKKLTKESSETTVETLSQIEAFVKKPLKNSTCLAKHTVQEKNTCEIPNQSVASSSTSSKAEVTGTSNEESAGKNSRRISGRRSSNSSATTSTSFNKLEVIIEDQHDMLFKSSDTITPNDSDEERKDCSRELKSDVDQSFAILESKSTKVKRKPKNDPTLDEIKISLTSHRRSMTTAEHVHKTPKEIIRPDRRSKRGSSLNKSTINSTEPKASIPVESDTGSKTRRSRRGSTSSGSGTNLSTRGNEINLETKNEENTNKSKRTVKRKMSEALDDKNKHVVVETEESDLKQSKSSRRTSKRQNVVSVDDAPSPKNQKEGFDAKLKIRITRSKQGVDSSEMESSKTGDSKSSSSIDDSEAPECSTSDKKKNAETAKGSENVINKKEPSSDTSEELIQTSRRTNKRQMTTSSEDDFAPNPIESPSKRSKMIKTSSTSSEEPEKKSRDNSISSDTISTPRRGKNAPTSRELLSSAERSRRKQKPKVVFTMLDSPQLESYIKHLGGSVVDSVDASTVLVTQSVKRSQKLLTAVAQGKPVCSANWIQTSKKKNEFQDPWDYILVDQEAETKWKFSLRESIVRANNIKLFADYQFHLMVTNALDVLKAAIEASGGKIITKIQRNNLDKCIVVATPEQKSKYSKIKKQYPDVDVVEPEAIFDGVLRQEFRISRHILT